MSSKTQKANAAKTASALSLLPSLMIVFVAYGLGRAARQSFTNPTLILGHQRYDLEITKTPAEQIHGLSDRNKLPVNHVMLFNFKPPAEVCFWMKEDVIYLERNLSPKTYPNSYCPTSRARYVLEFNAGISKQQNINIGSHIVF
jgi:uncharacterized membrane protein (UPF0127 family)